MLIGGRGRGCHQVDYSEVCVVHFKWIQGESGWI